VQVCPCPLLSAISYPFPSSFHHLSFTRGQRRLNIWTKKQKYTFFWVHGVYPKASVAAVREEARTGAGGRICTSRPVFCLMCFIDSEVKAVLDWYHYEWAGVDIRCFHGWVRHPLIYTKVVVRNESVPLVIMRLSVSQLLCDFKVSLCDIKVCWSYFLQWLCDAIACDSVLIQDG